MNQPPQRGGGSEATGAGPRKGFRGRKQARKRKEVINVIVRTISKRRAEERGKVSRNNVFERSG